MSSISHMTTHRPPARAIPPFFEVTEEGVFYVLPASTKQPGPDKDSSSCRIFVCSQLFITGRARLENSRGWSRVLEFTDESGTRHVYCMPMSLLAGSGERLKAELLDRGVRISVEPRAVRLLMQYLQHGGSDEILLIADRIGWHQAVYVLPDCHYGTTSHRIIYVPKNNITVKYDTKGTIHEWTQAVSRYANHNSRLTLAICAALAAPLLRVINLEGGALHVYGPSSLGKTTILKIAVSVWGAYTELMSTWRQTDNAQENSALAHNDSLLALDELSQSNPLAAAECAYMLANGYGKIRANASGEAANEKRWCVLVLSSGECNLAAHVATGGKTTLAGQETRFADIPADAEQGCGIFETLHGFPSGAALAQHLTDSALRFHGTAAREFLQQLTQDKNLTTQLQADVASFADELAGPNASSQVRRVAQRFALLAVAGELATRWGITGWTVGNAIWAVKRCFQAWLNARGGSGNLEEQRIIAHVKAFIEQHGTSRFEDINSTGEKPVHNRAGFRQTNENGETEYLFLPTTFQQVVLAGFDFRIAKRALLNGRMLILPLGEPNKIQVKRALPGFPTRTRVYAIRLPNEN